MARLRFYALFFVGILLWSPVADATLYNECDQLCEAEESTCETLSAAIFQRCAQACPPEKAQCLYRCTRERNISRRQCSQEDMADCMNGCELVYLTDCQRNCKEERKDCTNLCQEPYTVCRAACEQQGGANKEACNNKCLEQRNQGYSDCATKARACDDQCTKSSNTSLCEESCVAASLDTLQALCMHDLQSCTADCLNRDRASSVAGTSAFNVTDCLSGCLGASYLCRNEQFQRLDQCERGCLTNPKTVYPTTATARNAICDAAWEQCSAVCAQQADQCEFLIPTSTTLFGKASATALSSADAAILQQRRADIQALCDRDYKRCLSNCSTAYDACLDGASPVSVFPGSTTASLAVTQDIPMAPNLVASATKPASNTNAGPVKLPPMPTLAMRPPARPTSTSTTSRPLIAEAAPTAAAASATTTAPAVSLAPRLLAAPTVTSTTTATTVAPATAATATAAPLLSLPLPLDPAQSASPVSAWDTFAWSIPLSWYCTAIAPNSAHCLDALSATPSTDPSPATTAEQAALDKLRATCSEECSLRSEQCLARVNVDVDECVALCGWAPGSSLASISTPASSTTSGTKSTGGTGSRPLAATVTTAMPASADTAVSSAQVKNDNWRAVSPATRAFVGLPTGRRSLGLLNVADEATADASAAAALAGAFEGEPLTVVTILEGSNMPLVATTSTPAAATASPTTVTSSAPPSVVLPTVTSPAKTTPTPAQPTTVPEDNSRRCAQRCVNRVRQERVLCLLENDMCQEDCARFDPNASCLDPCEAELGSCAEFCADRLINVCLSGCVEGMALTVMEATNGSSTASATTSATTPATSTTKLTTTQMGSGAASLFPSSTSKTTTAQPKAKTAEELAAEGLAVCSQSCMAAWNDCLRSCKDDRLACGRECAHYSLP